MRGIYNSQDLGVLIQDFWGTRKNHNNFDPLYRRDKILWQGMWTNTLKNGVTVLKSERSFNSKLRKLY